MAVSAASAFDAVDGSSAGIAMCHIAVSLDGKRMSPHVQVSSVVAARDARSISDCLGG